MLAQRGCDGIIVSALYMAAAEFKLGEAADFLAACIVVTDGDDGSVSTDT
jgi:hypothetical protein